MKRARGFLLGVLSLLCAAGWRSHADFVLISEQQEVQIGQDAAKAVEQEYGFYKGTPGLQEYVNQMGQRLVSVCNRKSITYHFQVVDSPVINAFALPGGFVYVTRGILARINSEDELAMVMGHELAHVTNRHGAQEMSKGIVAQLGVGIFGTFQPELAQKYGPYASTALGLAMLGYSRGMESEADAYGMTYAIKAGYNPRGALKLFQMFESIEQHEPTQMERFLLSHPPTKERLAYAQDRVAQTAKQDGAFVDRPLKRDQYLRRIDGLQLGMASGDRVIQGGNFYQKAQRVSFSYPDAYGANLNPKEGEVELSRVVQAQNQQTAYIVGLEALPAKGAGDPESFLNAYLQGWQVPHQSKASDNLVTASGVPMRIRILDLSPKEGQFRMALGCFLRAQTAFLLYGYTSLAAFPQAKGEFQSILKSARFIGDQEIASLRPMKLRLVQAGAGDTWASLSQREWGKSELAPKLAAYNGTFSTDKQPGPGMLLKIPDKRDLNRPMG